MQYLNPHTASMRGMPAPLNTFKVNLTANDTNYTTRILWGGTYPDTRHHVSL